MILRMIAGVAAAWPRQMECLTSWNYPILITNETPILPAYQRAHDQVRGPDVIEGYVHDDLLVQDPTWHDRVLHEFDDPAVGVVGFGGARGHGYRDMYQKPFYYGNVGRWDFMSNMRDAEDHGRRFTGSCDVATFDSFAMFARSSIIDAAGGWPVTSPITYWLREFWLTCSARRQGFRCRFVGVAVDHIVIQRPEVNVRSYVLNSDSMAEHRWIYDNFKDVLPFEASV